MRNPNYLNKNSFDKTNSEVVNLGHIPEFEMADYDLNDPKELNKYISNIEKVVRTSLEYRAMVSYLRNNVNMNKCSFYKNVSNADTSKIKIHIHHEPFDLCSITNIVYRKRCAYRESLEIEMVAKEVMFLHYNMIVGLIPLAETVHELVHNKYLFIPVDRVFGSYQQFVNLYHEFIDEQQMVAFNEICDMTSEYNKNPIKEEENMSILSRGFIYYDIQDWDIPKYEDVVIAMRNRIDEIRQESDNM